MAHVQEVVGLNPAVYWMDVSDANSYYIFNEKGNKGSQMGLTKKKIFHKNSY
jgi:hypothetical protein